MKHGVSGAGSASFFRWRPVDGSRASFQNVVKIKRLL
jgi:hypothetical protein